MRTNRCRQARESFKRTRARWRGTPRVAPRVAARVARAATSDFGSGGFGRWSLHDLGAVRIRPRAPSPRALRCSGRTSCRSRRLRSPPAWNANRLWPPAPGTRIATVSITATSRVTARTRSRQVSGSFMWYSTPRYSTTSNVPSESRSTVAKSATTGSTLLPSAACAKSKPRRPGRSGSQKSVVSRA